MTYSNSLTSRRLTLGALTLFALIAFVLAPAGDAHAKKNKKSKSAAKKAKIVGKVASVKGSSLTVKSKGKNYSVKIAATTELAGRDSNDDGALDVDDISKGDNIRASGLRKGRSLVAQNVANLSDLLPGDDDGDGVEDSVDTEEVYAVVDNVNTDQQVLSVTVLKGDLAGQQLIVDAAAGAILVTGDRNKDGQRDLADVTVGDQLKLVLLSPVNPDNPQALVIIDKTTLGQANRRKRPRGGLPVVGAVQSVDSETGQVTIVPSVDGVDLPAVAFATDEKTKFEIVDSNGDSIRDLADITVGQQLKAILRGIDGKLVALKVEDEVWEDDEGRPGDGSQFEDQEVRGLVAGVDLEAKTIDVANPISGETRQISFDENTDIRTPDTNGDGSHDAADIIVGAKLEAVIDNNDRAIRLAVHVEDRRGDDQEDDDPQPGQPGGQPNQPGGPSNKPGEPGARPQPLVLKGRVAAKTADSVSVRIDGGPLENQVVTAIIVPQTLFGLKQDNNGDGLRNLDDINVGNEIIISINNPTEKKAVMVFCKNEIDGQEDD